LLQEIERFLAHRYQGEKILSGADLAEPNAAKVVNARNMACPGTLLETKRAIAGVKPGEILEVLSNDPEARADIRAWADKAGHEYLGYVEAECHDRLFVARK